MKQLDEHYGDLENHIIGQLYKSVPLEPQSWYLTDREIEIMQDLVERLREVDSQIMLLNDVMAELDWSASKSESLSGNFSW